MTHLAIVTPDWPSICDGGVASLMATLALGLGHRGARVTVFVRGGGHRGAALARATGLEAWPDLDVTTVALPGRSWSRLGGWHWRRGLASRLAGFDAVVVARQDELAAVLACAPADVPVGVFAHGRDITAPLPAGRARRRRSAFSAPVRWFCLTRWMQELLAARGAAADVVPGAVPEAPRMDAGSELLSVGRLIPRKGHAVLLDAVARFDAPPLTIAGDGPERAALLARVAALGIADRVSLPGFVPTPLLEQHWRRAAVLAMPCRTEARGDTEGFGLVFAEAAARGIPTIAGAGGGVAEAVIDGVTGIVLQDPTDPVALAQALRGLLADPALRRRLGDVARERQRAHARPIDLAAAVLHGLGIAEAAA